MKSKNALKHWTTILGFNKKGMRNGPGARRLIQVEKLEDRRLLTVSLPELVSINGLSDATASGPSEYTSQSLSADGRYQVFTSWAPDIVPLDLNGTNDVFWRDLQTGATTLISRAVGGGTADSSSQNAVISADGAYVAFHSSATNLDVAGINSTSGYSQIYRWQRSTGQIQLVSPNAGGTDGGNNYSYEPSINENGTRIAFRTYADDLLAGVIDINGATDVYLRDLTGTPATILVSQSSTNPLQTANGSADSQRMSRDGSRVVYRTSSTDVELGVTDINGANSDLVAFEISTQSNQYISVESTAPSSGNAGSSRTEQSLSDDGRYEVFASDAGDLVDGDTNGTTDVFLHDLLTGMTILISRTSSGSSANSSSHHAVISGDGNYVAFYSHATDLNVPAPGVNSTNGYAQIYRWHRATGEIELISVNSSDTNGGDYYSYYPTISGDGQRVAYQSLAQDLITGLVDVNGWTIYDIFLRDLSGVPTTILVSHSSANSLQTADSGSDSQRMSHDGSRIVYRTTATDIELGVTDINGTGADLVSYEIAAPVVRNRYISVQSTAPSSGNAGSSRTEQSLSDDGRYEVFASDAGDLVDGDTNGTTDVFLHDLLTGTTTLVSRTSSGNSANSSSHHAVISGDGNYVAFYSHATDLNVPAPGVNSTNGYAQIYRWHRATGEIELISVNSSDTNGGDYYSYYPTISGDGQRVAYQSLAQDLITSLVDPNGWWNYDIFLRDLTGLPTTTLVSRSSANPLQTGDAGSAFQRISHDGSTVAFLSSASDLVSGVTDGNGTSDDLFAFHISLGTMQAVNLIPGGTSTGNSPVDNMFSLSDNGQVIAFASYATDLHPMKTDSYWDVFARDLSLPFVGVELISVDNLGVEADWTAYRPRLDASGEFVAFESSASNLDVLPSSWLNNVYVRDRFTSSTHLVSVNSAGTAGGDNHATEVIISRDGSTVAFVSSASDLDGNQTDTNGTQDVFVRDWQAVNPTTRLISRNVSGADSANANSWQPALSETGAALTFSSSATDLVSSSFDANDGAQDVFAYQGSAIELVTAKGFGKYTGQTGVDTVFDISDTGQYVAFSSYALGMSDILIGNGQWQVYVRDLTATSTELISESLLGGVGESHSWSPSISGNGQYIAFQSHAQLDSLDNNWSGYLDVFVRDRNLSTTHLVSINSAGTNSGDNSSQTPRISLDGSTIAFESYASDLDGSVTDSNGVLDVFTRDWQGVTPTTRLVSRDAASSDSGNAGSSQPTLSATGAVLSFISQASNLVSSHFDANGGAQDVFAYQGSAVELVTAKGSGNFTGQTGVDSVFDISDTGQYVAFSSYASGMSDSVIGNGQWQVYIRDLTATSTELISESLLGGMGESHSWSPSISGNGQYIAFHSHAQLDSLDNNWSGYLDVFVRDRNLSSTHLVSINSAGTNSGDSSSQSPRISRDGSTLVFESYSSDLDANVTDTNQLDVFLRKWNAPSPVTDLLSRDASGTNSSDNTSQFPIISENGATAVFHSYGTNLTVLSDGNAGLDIFAVKAASMAISPASAVKPEGNTGLLGYTFTVQRSWFTQSAFTVDWVVSGIGPNPANSADFSGSFPSGQLSFGIGETSKTITVNVSGDQLVELDENFRVTLSNSTNNSQIVTSTADGLIQNNDSAVINIGNVTLTEGSGGGTTAFNFDVTISNPVDVSVSMQANSQNGTATAPSDFTGVVALPVVFSAANTTTQQVTVQVNRDNLFELNETFQVLLSSLAASGRNVSQGTSTGIGSILNDDFASIVGRFANHAGYSGVGSPEDTGKALAQEGPVPVELGYNNLINTSRGINGLVFDIDGLPGTVTASDFVFQMSPTGAYNVGANPPASWTNAPAPSSVGVTPGAPSRVLVAWPNNAIANRWLRITVLANANTGLQSAQVYYLGHLLGETTGAVGGVFTVAFADITPIRGNAGATVNANSIYDIDKSGTVSFADISAMRSNIGAQLPAFTIPASGSGELLGEGESGSGSVLGLSFSLPSSNDSDENKVEISLQGGFWTPVLDQYFREVGSRRKNMLREAAFDLLMSGDEFDDIKLVDNGFKEQNDLLESVRIDRAIELLTH